ncbi:MAG: ferrochelatase [Bdellovibrionales bacterium]
MADKVLVLVNLGSPDLPTPKAVGRYLREFLMDPQVIDKPFWLRALLVYGVIVPFRRRRSALAYQKIWTEQGSPLKVHTAALAKAMQKELGPTWRVDWAMRYGSPSLDSLFQLLASEKPKELLVLPLYPQEAKSSSGTVRLVVQKWAGRFQGQVQVIEPFFSQKEFLDAYAAVIEQNWARQSGDYLLFSFHGLPERHMRETDPGPGGCLQSAGCCEPLTARNQHCYRAQCFATAAQLAVRLGLQKDQWSVSFQSRLGREPWIQPFTDVVLPELAKAGKRRVFVSCPAFVADCLETVEEIGLRAKSEYEAMGGELTLLPSLNSSAEWVKRLALALREDRWPKRPVE